MKQGSAAGDSPSEKNEGSFWIAAMSGQNEDELICDKSCVRSSQASGFGAGPLRKIRCGKVGRGASFHYAVAKSRRAQATARKRVPGFISIPYGATWL